MAKKKGEDINKENDAHTSAVMKIYNKDEKLRTAIGAAMEKPEMQQKVKDFIFSGVDSELESPLNDIRNSIK
jgi:hypothetical protein